MPSLLSLLGFGDSSGKAGASGADFTAPGPRSAFVAQAVLTWSALGVIYGDIGTSPLYTVASILADNETFDRDDIYMVISLIFWMLTLVTLIKYVFIVLHANDHGEGGTFALYTRICRSLGVSPLGTMAEEDHDELLVVARRSHTIARRSKLGTLSGLQQVYSPSGDLDLAAPAASITAPAAYRFSDGDQPLEAAPGWWTRGALPATEIRRWFRESVVAQRVLLLVAMLTTGMVLADGVLTPVVSVVGAMAGLKVAKEDLSQDVVVGASCGLLVALFAVQFLGTHRVSFMFTPIVALWLTANAIIGVYNISSEGPGIFKALSPHYIVSFFERYGTKGWERLASVMLAVTGSEAMFADLGHFSIPAVSISWSFFAYPALVLTYIGQGAYLLGHPDDVANTYWASIPNPIFYPMLVLATLASLVASQALISASFSITKQAKALGVIPSMHIVHTSAEHEGQIYVPAINWLLMVLTVAVTAGFNADSVALGYAYGLTISIAMLATTFLVALVMVTDWKLSTPLVLAFFGAYGLIDGAIVSANMIKVPVGGWLSLTMAAVVFAFMFVWWLGQMRLHKVMDKSQVAPGQLFTAVPLLKTQLLALPPTDANGNSAIPAVRGGSAALATVTERPGSTTTSGTTPSPLQRGTGAAADVPVSTRILRGDMGLALTGGDEPLVTLPGIAIMYTESAHGLPHVLRHFLRNVPALHEVNVFLWVRHFPLPTIPPEERLKVAAVAGMPSFYRVEAQYGYLDVVRHDDEFVQELVQAVGRMLVAGPGGQMLYAHIRTSVDMGPAVPAPPAPAAAAAVADGASGSFASPRLRKRSVGGLGSSSSGPHVASLGTKSVPVHAMELSGVVVDGAHSTMDPQTSLEVPLAPPRLRLDVARITRGLAHSASGAFSSLGTKSAGVAPAEVTAVAPSADAGERGIAAQSAALSTVSRASSFFTTMQNIAADIRGTSPKSAGIKYAEPVQEAALRVANLLDAAANGVTYYHGLVSLRVKPGANPLHALVYGHLYKPLLLLAYNDNDQWEVPVNDLVEVGMVVHI